jgi:hypothetical protein
LNELNLKIGSKYLNLWEIVYQISKLKEEINEFVYYIFKISVDEKENIEKYIELDIPYLFFNKLIFFLLP